MKKSLAITFMLIALSEYQRVSIYKEQRDNHLDDRVKKNYSKSADVLTPIG